MLRRRGPRQLRKRITNETFSLPPQPIKETPKTIEQDNSNPAFNSELSDFAYRLNYQFPKLTERQLKEVMDQLQAHNVEDVAAILVWVANSSQRGSSYDEIIGSKQYPMVGAWKDADFDVKQYEMSREDYG